MVWATKSSISDHYCCAERVQVEAQLRQLRLGAVGRLVQLPLELWEAGYN